VNAHVPPRKEERRRHTCDAKSDARTVMKKTIRDGKDVIRPSNRRGLDIAAKAAICVQTVAVSWRPAIRRVSRSWLRPSSICEPSDPPPGVVCGVSTDDEIHRIFFASTRRFTRFVSKSHYPSARTGGRILPRALRTGPHRALISRAAASPPAGAEALLPWEEAPRSADVCVPKQQHRQ
jgi:hypothetical protein